MGLPTTLKEVLSRFRESTPRVSVVGKEDDLLDTLVVRSDTKFNLS